MSVDQFLELLTRGAPLTANLAPLFHENSKLSFARDRCSPASSLCMDRARTTLASFTPGILLSPVDAAAPTEELSLAEVSVILRALDRNELHTYVLAWAVDGLSAGSYYFYQPGAKLILVRRTGARSNDRLVIDGRELGAALALIVFCSEVRPAGAVGSERHFRNTLVAAGRAAGQILDVTTRRGRAARLISDFFDDPLGLDLGVDPAIEPPLTVVAISERT